MTNDHNARDREDLVKFFDHFFFLGSIHNHTPFYEEVTLFGSNLPSFITWFLGFVRVSANRL
jgi:hypothetical protein